MEFTYKYFPFKTYISIVSKEWTFGVNLNSFCHLFDENIFNYYIAVFEQEQY